MKKGWLIASFIGCMLLPIWTSAASTPKFSLSPLTPTALQLPTNNTAVVSYLVKNNTKYSRQLTTVPIPGVTQIVNGSTCASPFVLNPNQTCVLSLQITGNQIPNNGIHDGPVVCKTMGNGNSNPDPFLCSRPDASSNLNITPSLPTGHFVWQENGIAVSRVRSYTSSNGVITLSNTNMGSIHNLQISIPSPYSSYFTNGCGSTLAPNSSCTITYSIPAPAFLGSFSLTATATDVDNSSLTLPVDIFPFGSAMYCWGTNDYGQLGNNTITPFTPQPTTPVSGLSNVIKAGAGSEYMCGLQSTGIVQCWGRNNLGQLGDETNNDSSVPVQVSNINTAIDLSVGETHACAVLANGTIQCWGMNNYGQLGNEDTVDSNEPVSVTGITNAIKVSAGSEYTCAMLATGQIYCWGRNNSGQFGNGTQDDSLLPTPTSNITNAIGLTAVAETTCALLANNQVQCWGKNNNGAVGNGTSGGVVLVPNTVIDGSDNILTNIIRISSRGDEAIGVHVCAVNSTGLVFCWGLNNYGQLGNGDAPNASNKASAVVGLINEPVVDVGSGASHACSVLMNGQMQCWGNAINGQLDNGQTVGVYDTAQLSLNISTAIATLEHDSSYISCAIVE